MPSTTLGQFKDQFKLLTPTAKRYEWSYVVKMENQTLRTILDSHARKSKAQAIADLEYVVNYMNALGTTVGETTYPTIHYVIEPDTHLVNWMETMKRLKSLEGYYKRKEWEHIPMDVYSFVVGVWLYLNPKHQQYLGDSVVDSVYSSSLCYHSDYNTQNPLKRKIEELKKAVSMSNDQEVALLAKNGLEWILRALRGVDKTSSSQTDFV
jgi:hypothetical protein